MLLVLLAVAHAAIPPLYAQPEPTDIATAFEDYAKGQGKSGPATQIRCAPLVEGVVLCFRYVHDGHLTYVTQSEAVAWHADDPALVAAATAQAATLDDARFERMPVADMPGAVYWVSRKGDGLDGAAFLDPRRLDRVAGGPAVVAMPAAGTLLFWRPDGGDLDRIVAVGVRRMADASDHPISDRIFRWDGTVWRVWGETVPNDASTTAGASGSGSGSGTR
jgi:hypothetical protein